MRSVYCAAFLLAWICQACAQQKQTQVTTMPAGQIAFPGAEGFGKYTTGGRGGSVYIVSNLQDDGEGSLRQGVTAKRPTIVVFAISGTIHLESKLVIQKNITIAGQTAPGDGICIADHPVGLGGDNIIVRYLRFRMGDRYQNKGQVDGAGGDDAFGGARRKNIIIDHCSMSWSTDEVCSIYGGDSTTLQWNIISEPLNYSYHFETGDKDFEHHGYGGIWGGRHLSAHHNLFAHCTSRNPRFNGVRLGADKELADFRNNVIYNWGGNTIYGGEAGEYNIVGNYYKYGPSTSKTVKYRIVNPTKEEKGSGFGRFYVAGNYVDEAKDVTANNDLGIHMGKGATDADRAATVATTAFDAITLPAETATAAYAAVLKKAGASLPQRDTLDQRIIENVKNRTGAIIDVQGGYPHGTSYAISQQAWPVLHSIAAPADTDRDGMPDEWEKKKGLNPADPKDAVLYTLDKSYTNIEMYINSITAD